MALAGCEGTFGDSPPHAAPSDPTAEGEDGAVVLTWGAVTDAESYVILWDTDAGAPVNVNQITGIEATTFIHTGLENLTRYRYRIVAATSGGRGPESVAVTAIPGPVAGAVEWAVVTAQNPGHTIHFAPAAGATHYRVYFAPAEAQLSGRRPSAAFEEADAPPHVRKDVPVTSSLYYRVIAMNDSRIGTGGPVVVSPSRLIAEHELTKAGAAFGRVNDDDCTDLPTALGVVNAGACTGSFTARVLADAGLADLTASPRVVGDARFADLNGDGFDELVSNTLTPATEAGSVALLHVNQGNGNFQASAAVTALGIGGFGGTLLSADFDNDGDVDVFAPNDHTRGDGARNWLLMNDGAGGITDTAAAAGIDTNPAGTAYVPRGGQAVDFDEDGFVDLLFGSRLMHNDGDGTFSDLSAAANVPVLADQGLKLIDVDLDGDLDLVHRTASETRLFTNVAGVFGAGEVIGGDVDGATGFGLTACDLNGDGFEDVIWARNLAPSAVGAPRMLLNVNGTLMLTATQEGVPADPDAFVALNSLLACGDQDADGDLDVLALWGPGGKYRLLLGAQSLTRRIRLRIVGSGGHRNQQGRIVRVVPESAPNRIMTRVVESGSGLRSQGMYDLIFGAPWPGDYTVTVRFADGDVTATLEAGDEKIISEDGTVTDINPEEAT